jgi:hypothetical protein
MIKTNIDCQARIMRKKREGFEKKLKNMRTQTKIITKYKNIKNNLKKV